MEPVELTVITRNKTKEGLDEIIRDTSKVGRTVEQVTADFKARMQEQSDVVKQVEADIKSLEKQLSKASPGKAKMELAADLEVAKKVLAEEKGGACLVGEAGGAVRPETHCASYGNPQPERTNGGDEGGNGGICRRNEKTG